MGPEDEVYSDLLVILEKNDYFYPKRSKSDEGKVAFTAVDPGAGKTTDTRVQQTLLRKEVALRIRTGFQQKLQELRGACYSTEVRDSGVLVCGVHHSLWNESTESCVTLGAELDALSLVATDALSSVNLGKSESAKSLAARERLRLLDRAMGGVQP